MIIKAINSSHAAKTYLFYFIPYFRVYNAHVMYNAHAKVQRASLYTFVDSAQLKTKYNIRSDLNLCKNEGN